MVAWSIKQCTTLNLTNDKYVKSRNKNLQVGSVGYMSRAGFYNLFCFPGLLTIALLVMVR